MIKIIIVWIIFSSKFSWVCFHCQQYTLFSSTYTRDTQTQAAVTMKIYVPGLDHIGATYFLTLCDWHFGNHCPIIIGHTSKTSRQPLP